MGRPSPGRRPRAALGAGLLLALIAGCSRPAAEKSDLDTAPPKTTALSVRTVAAQPGQLSVQRTASATIEAERDSRVATQSAGTVQALSAGEGEQVARGDVVVQLDDTAQRQALESARLQVRQAQISLDQTRRSAEQATVALQASLSSAQSALLQAQQNAKSAEQLYGLGGVSFAELQSARSGLAQAEAQVAQARQSLDQNGRSAQGSVPLAEVQLQTAQASLRQAEENLSRTRVRAPFAGTVAEITAKVGEFAGQGTPVFRLVDPGTIRVKFNVPTADATGLTEGSRFVLAYGGKNYTATVTGGAGIAGDDRLVPVTARVYGGAALPVGGTAQARYRAELGGGLLIPSSALQVEGGQSAVYTAEGGVARRQVVSVVAETGGQLAVSGLSAGARVIDPVPASLRSGAKVRVEGSETGGGSNTGKAGQPGQVSAP